MSAQAAQPANEGTPFLKLDVATVSRVLMMLSATERTTARIVCKLFNKSISSAKRLKIGPHWGAQIRTLDSLHCLRELTVEVASINCLPTFPSSLDTLRLCYCTQLMELDALSSCSESLCTLIIHFTRVKSLEALSCCHGLRKLVLDVLWDGGKWPHPNSFPLLEYLKVEGKGSAQDLVRFAPNSLTTLVYTHASVAGSPLIDISALAYFSSLQHLDICHNESVTDFSVLENMPSLRSLVMKFCLDAKVLPSLSRFRDLRVMDLTMVGQGLTSPVDLSQLTSCTELHTLALQSLPHSNLNALSVLSSLTALSLSDVMSDVPTFSVWPALRTISLREENLTDTNVLEGCTLLQTLDLGKSYALTDITSLASCTSLRIVDFGSCRSLTDVTPLATCRLLHTLVVWDTKVKYADADNYCANINPAYDSLDCVFHNGRTRSDCSYLRHAIRP